MFQDVRGVATEGSTKHVPKQNCGFKKNPQKTPQQLVLQGAIHKYTCTLVLNAFSYVDCRAFAVSSVSLDPHPPF